MQLMVSTALKGVHVEIADTHKDTLITNELDAVHPGLLRCYALLN